MKLLKNALLLGASMAFATSSAMAAFTFTDGDLILGFQATSGQGSSQNVFFNLGSGTSLRDGTNSSVFGNINSTLESVYGEGWYDRDDISFGVVGNLNSTNPGGASATPAVNGDPSRTIYVSRPTNTPGQSILLTGFSSSSLGTGGGRITGMETMIVGLDTELDGAAILNQTTQPTLWNNGWSAQNTSSSFSIFTNIQQSLGKDGDITFIDIQRILATNTGANPTGTVGTGSYINTIGIGRDGSISAVPETSTSLLAIVATGLAVLRRRRSSN